MAWNQGDWWALLVTINNHISRIRLFVRLRSGWDQMVLETNVVVW